MNTFTNPYSGADSFHFIETFFTRIFLIIKGRAHLASDELQIIILSLIGASAALVGVFLIYRRMTMLANALSHSVLFGVAITAFFLRASFKLQGPHFNFKGLFITALLTGFLTAFLSQLVSKVSRLQKDAAIGLVFTTLFAIGVLLISIFSRNAHIGAELVLGNVDALHIQDLPGVFLMFLLNLFIVSIFFRGLKLTTFDPIFAHMQGLSLSLYNYLTIFLLSITSIGAFRAIGVVLVLSFFVVPPLIAKLFTKSLQGQIAFAIGVGILASFCGVCLTRHILSVYQVALSTGGITVLSLYTLYFLSFGSLFVVKQFRQLKPILTGGLNEATEG